MQLDPGSLSRRCPGDRAVWEHREPGDSACERTCCGRPGSAQGMPVGTAPAWCPISAQARGHSRCPTPGCPAKPSSQKEPSEARGTQELAAGSHQVAPRRVRYLPSRPLQMPGGRAASNPGPSPASSPQAEPQRRRAASQGAAALPAGGFSVSFRALAGTGLPGARRGRGRECARVGRCGRAWMWVCMCVCVFMGEVGVCVRV